MRSLMVRTVAKLPSSRMMGSSSTTGGSGACARMETLGVMERRGRSLLAGLARPARPRRWTLPMTALRVTPPSTRAIWLADSPSVQSDLSCSTLSSVHMICDLPDLVLDIVAVGWALTRPAGQTLYACPQQRGTMLFRSLGVTARIGPVFAGVFAIGMRRKSVRVLDFDGED